MGDSSRPCLLPGLCSVTFRACDPATVLDLAARAGLPAIEWGGDVHAPPGDPAHLGYLRAATLDAGIGAISYGSYVAPGHDPASDVRAALDAASALGAGSIRVWAGQRGRASAGYAPEERRATALALRQAAGIAADRGLALVLEYHPGTLTDGVTTALRLVEEIGHDNAWLGWQLHPGQDAESAVQDVSRLGPHLAHIHVFNWDRKSNRYALAADEDGWRRILEAVPAGGYGGPRGAFLECSREDDPAAFLEEAAVLRRLPLGQAAARAPCPGGDPP